MATITKGVLVDQMFKMLRISAGLTTEPDAEEVGDALTILERVVLALENKGLFLGYNKAEYLFEPDPSEESGIRDTDVHAIVLLLCKNVAPLFGKVLPPDLLTELDDAMMGLYDHTAPVRVQNPYQPAGQGNRQYCFGDRYYTRYMPEEDRLTVTNGGQLEDLQVIEPDTRNSFHGN